MKHLSRRISFPVLLTALLLSVFVLSDVTVMAAGKTKMIVPKKKPATKSEKTTLRPLPIPPSIHMTKKGM